MDDIKEIAVDLRASVTIWVRTFCAAAAANLSEHAAAALFLHLQKLRICFLLLGKKRDTARESRQELRL